MKTYVLKKAKPQSHEFDYAEGDYIMEDNAPKRRIVIGDRVSYPHPMSGRIMEGTVVQAPTDDRMLGIRWDERPYKTDWHGRASVTLL